MSAFTKRFLRENSDFLVSETAKVFRKQSKTNQILKKRALGSLSAQLENCPQSSEGNTPSPSLSPVK
jgi:hypothetical protein